MLNDRTLGDYMNLSVVSLLVMYKTWSVESYRDIVVLMINKLKGFKLPDSEEISVLNSLCEHECIRPSVRFELKKLFN
jgi:hypothetical protein